MEIRLFKYVSHEKWVKPSSPKQACGESALRKPQPSLPGSFEVVFVSTERKKRLFFCFSPDCRLSCLRVRHRAAFNRTEIPLQSS